MNPELEQKIIGMAELANPTTEQVRGLLLGWKEYFRIFDVSSQRQPEEFSTIIRARVQAGQISIIAPDNRLL